MNGGAHVYTVEHLEHERVIDLPSLTNDEAVDLGLTTIEVIRERDLPLAVEIVVRGSVVFRATLKSTGPDNDVWLRGKAAVALHFAEPSLLVKLRHLESGVPFHARDDVDHDEMRAFGGSIPLRVLGNVVGTLTVSGEPDEIDHLIAEQSLRRYVERRS